LNSLSKSKFRGRCSEAFYFSTIALSTQTFENVLLSFRFDKLPEIQIDNFDEVALKELRKQHDPGINEDAESMISEMGTKLPYIQKALKDFLEKTQEVLIRPKIQISPITEEEYRSYEIDLPQTENRLDIRSIPGGFYWERVSVPQSYSERDWAILNLAKLMDGFNIGAITRCKGCGRYFFNASAREKIYCSSSCASRSIAHKKYEELKKNPRKYKAHLKKYRKYSEERYKRLREIQYGPNIKIQKRKNRRKEG
jgi:hypothetical protein